MVFINIFSKNTIGRFVNTQKLNLLTANQLLSNNKLLLALSTAASTDLPVTKILVSSANNLILQSGAQFWMSLTYNKNNKGPNTDPCGTPHVIEPKSDTLLAIVTTCCQINLHNNIVIHVCLTNMPIAVFIKKFLLYYNYVQKNCLLSNHSDY